jgi:hypothetical protein
LSALHIIPIILKLATFNDKDFACGPESRRSHAAENGIWPPGGQSKECSNRRRPKKPEFDAEPVVSIPRDHHFIPAFALAPWAVKDSELVEYSIKHQKLIPKWVGPRGTGFVRDLYAFAELPPEHAQHLESVFFNYADDKAAQALQLHIQNKAASNDELSSPGRDAGVARRLRLDLGSEWTRVSGTL